jgi:hypothetical protein
VVIKRALSVALAALLILGCGAEAPAAPSIDIGALQTLVDEALVEVGNVAANPPEIDLPPEIDAFLAEHQIQLPPLPSNAAEICNVLTLPGASALGGAGLGALAEGVSGLELGLVVGLLVTVVFRTCPVWSPHLEQALEELL